MRAIRSSCAGLGVVLGAVAAAPALAAASASVTVNGATVIDLSSSGAQFAPFDFIEFTLRPGESRDLDYAWRVMVSDDGLPATFEPSEPRRFFDSPTDCVPLIVTTCGLPPTGFEQMRVLLEFAFLDTRSSNPGPLELTFSGESRIDLATQPGPTADAATRSGHTRLHVENPGPVEGSFGGTLRALSYAAAWGYAAAVSPIPEPTTSAMLLAGLAVLGAAGARRRAP